MEIPFSLPRGRDALAHEHWPETGLNGNEAFLYIVGMARGSHPLSFDHMVRSGVPAGEAARQLLYRVPGKPYYG
jgi:hypothetical protein